MTLLYRTTKKQIGTHREKKHALTLTLMLVRGNSACKTSAGSTPLLGPNLDPKTGPKQRPKRRNENVIQFWTTVHFVLFLYMRYFINPLLKFPTESPTTLRCVRKELIRSLMAGRIDPLEAGFLGLVVVAADVSLWACPLWAWWCPMYPWDPKWMDFLVENSH